jgi:hypothetical protein
MSLESIYYIGQTIAVFALLVSIVFVGVQVHLNTKATRASASYEVSKVWSEINFQILAVPGGAQLIQRSMEPGAKVEDFTADEISLLHVLMRAVLYQFEGQFCLFVEGSLPEENWASRSEWAGNLVRLPVQSRIFEAEVAMGSFLPAFVEELRRDVPHRDLAIGDPLRLSTKS